VKTRVFKRKSGGFKTTIPKAVAELFEFKPKDRIEWIVDQGGFLIRKTSQEAGRSNITTLYALKEGQIIVTIPSAIAGSLQLESGSNVYWRFDRGYLYITRV
jgi:bifunctional DNA-binding transcriptional regulator/antitoxin component of YhaV-PrlF toxin-antitoxin module